MSFPEPRAVRYRLELFGLLSLPAELPEGLKVRLLDLSEGGAFIEQPDLPADAEIQEGDPVELTLAFPGIGKWIVAGTVSRFGKSRLELKRPKAAHVTVMRAGFAIAFDALSDDALEQLRDFLELVEER